MKIVRLQASNFKRLVAVEIAPDGNLVTITGVNGAGKSSVLDAIAAAMGGSKASPDKPIREGEGTARVVVETEDYTVTRKYTLGRSTLEIKNKGKSTVTSPQALLDKLVGSIAFDPLAFSQMKDKDQRETILEVLGLDLDVHDAVIEELRNERKELLAAKRRADGDLDLLAFTPSLPDEEVSVAELSQQLTDAHAINAKAQRLDELFAQKQSQIKDNHQLIAAAEAALKTLSGECEQISRECSEITLVDTGALEQQIASAEETNKQVRENQSYRLAEKQAESLADSIKGKYDEIQEAEAAKSNAIGEAQMPVEGLSIDANGLTLDGIPFRQVNHAKRLEVSIAVAGSMNPELRVMLVNGNGLNTETVATLAAYAEKHDFQVWLEQATDSGEGFGIEIVDGMVKA